MISNFPNVGTVFTNGIELFEQVGGQVISGKYLVRPVSQNPLGLGC